ncbi:putative translation initiation factor 3 complex subunit L [Helianthus anomalus]
MIGLDLIPGLSNRRFPYQWLWDMVDEFVNQFHSFYELRATYPTKLNKICQVRQAGIIRQVWSLYCVLILLEPLTELLPDRETKDGLQLWAASGGCCDSEYVSIAVGYFSRWLL